METQTNSLITVEDLRQSLPSRKNAITQEAVDIMNRAMTEPEFQGEGILRTAITYEALMKKHRASIIEYINAIRFCAYMITSDNCTEAYKKTFCDREFVKSRINEPTDSGKYKQLTASASRYRTNSLVKEILTLSQVPLDLMFTGERYKALAVLAELTQTAKLDRDRINAAKELLAATKGPENVKIALDVGTQENSAIAQLNDQLANIAARQQSMLESGAGTLSEFGALKVKDTDILEGEMVKDEE